MAFIENAQSIKENIPKLWLLSKKRDKEGGGKEGKDLFWFCDRSHTIFQAGLEIVM